jgi:hypothetical protein
MARRLDQFATLRSHISLKAGAVKMIAPTGATAVLR